MTVVNVMPLIEGLIEGFVSSWGELNFEFGISSKFHLLCPGSGDCDLERSGVGQEEIKRSLEGVYIKDQEDQ